MGIIIKKKSKLNKKKIIKRLIVLIFVYLISFFSLYAFFGEKQSVEIIKEPKVINYKNDGEKYMAEHDYSAAIEYYLHILDFNSEDYISMTNLAIAYKNLKQFEKAKFYIFKSKEIAPGYIENYVQIASVYIEEGNLEVAENAINNIPVSTKESFLQKANLLIKLAEKEKDIDEKIIYYEKALTYLKKYNYQEYLSKVENLIELFFELKKTYMAKNDIDAMKNINKRILSYKNTCTINNMIASQYLGFDDDEAIKSLIKASKQAQTQEEKRLTKKNIINFKYRFEKYNDINKIKIMNGLLNMFGENSIVQDERFANFKITQDKLQLIKNIPQLTFSIQNKTNVPTNKLFVKAELHSINGSILDKMTLQVVKSVHPLTSKSRTKTQVIKLNRKIEQQNADKYNVTLSFSYDKQNWKLYKIYEFKTTP